MPLGRAPIAETSTIESMYRRRRGDRKPVGTGVLSVLTVVFWAVWIYLVLPLLSLLLWVLGVQLFVAEMATDGAESLVRSLLAYSTVLLVMVAALLSWILWNTVRYGGHSDRRTRKLPEVQDEEIGETLRLDFTLLEALRNHRFARIDIDDEECVVVLGTKWEVAAPGGGLSAEPVVLRAQGH